MPNIACCPERQELQQFALGQLAPADIERLERHLDDCGSCLTVLEQLASADSLVDTLRSRDETPVPCESSIVCKLMARLQGQPPSAAVDATAEFATPTPLSETATLAPAALTASAAADRGRFAFLAPPQQPDEIGRLGPYRVLQVLGAGGMGVVFRAENLNLGRTAALKVMLPAMAAAASAPQRFLREARTAAAIEHDHVVKVYEVDEDRGVPFLAMQLLRGESLDDRLKRQGRLPLAEVLRIGREIALGLAAAHEGGLIHRDIKPANLWLEEEQGRVKILDFGLARAAQDGAHLTQSGLIVGTPAYMAPEQSRGRGVDHRADLFSLGCVLYRCCTGQLPFTGTDTLSILAALALDNPTPPRHVNPEVSPGLSRLVMWLLAKDPAKRPPSADAVVAALTAVEAGEPVEFVDEVDGETLELLPADADATDVLEVIPVEEAPRTPAPLAVGACRRRGGARAARTARSLLRPGRLPHCHQPGRIGHRDGRSQRGGAHQAERRARDHRGYQDQQRNHAPRRHL